MKDKKQAVGRRWGAPAACNMAFYMVLRIGIGGRIISWQQRSKYGRKLVTSGNPSAAWDVPLIFCLLFLCTPNGVYACHIYSTKINIYNEFDLIVFPFSQLQKVFILFYFNFNFFMGLF